MVIEDKDDRGYYTKPGDEDGNWFNFVWSEPRTQFDGDWAPCGIEDKLGPFEMYERKWKINPIVICQFLDGNDLIELCGDRVNGLYIYHPHKDLELDLDNKCFRDTVSGKEFPFNKCEYDWAFRKEDL